MKVKIFITSIKYFSVIDKLPKYIQPLGLGKEYFPNNWLTENKGDNIKKLNKYYGELTGFYWVWKNLIENFGQEDFIGFCHYRKLWMNFLGEKKFLSYKSIQDCLLNENNKLFAKNDVFQVQPIIFKRKNLLEDFFTVHKINLMIESLNFLEEPIKTDFYNYLNKKTLYPLNMFIVKKDLFVEYCTVLFPWLEKCYDYCYKNDLLKDYNIRLPAFLAERFTSFWFNKFKNKSDLSYARLGNFFLSNNINKYINPLKIPFTSKIYPTIHRY